jgi:hypothetical protein
MPVRSQPVTSFQHYSNVIGITEHARVLQNSEMTHWIEVLPEHAPAGRRLLNLGDQGRQAVAMAGRCESANKIPGRGRMLAGLHHILQRLLGLPLHTRMLRNQHRFLYT